MLIEPYLFDTSPHILSIVTKLLNSIFGDVIIPRNPIVMQKREQTIAISEQPLLQSLRCIGLINATREIFKECRHNSGMLR